MAAVALASAIQSWPAWANTSHPFENGLRVKGFGCNSVSFATHPALGDVWVARILNNTDPADLCSGTTISLALAKMDWKKLRLQQLQKTFDTSAGGVPIGDGHIIASAYDPSVEAWNTELWVAFECTGPGLRASSCVGPLASDQTIDRARTTVVVKGTSADSASVPSLLSHQGHLYLYWTDVHANQAVWSDITGWGTELTQEQSGLRRLLPKASDGTPIMTPLSPKGALTMEVFGLDPNDPRSNTTADIQSAVSDGTWIYFTGGRGGSGCVTPLGTEPGCYRLTIGRSKSPLAYHSFNQELIPDSILPPNPQEYYRFVYRRDKKSTWLVGGVFLNPANLPNVMTGMWAFPWPDNIRASRSLPAIRPLSPTVFPISFLWQTIGGASPSFAVVGSGDFSGDARDDVLFRDPTTGDMGYYVITASSGAVTWHPVGGSSPSYSVVGIGAFSRAGVSEVMFRGVNGDTGYYQIVNDATVWHPLGVLSPSYSVIGIGDFNKDGTSDVMFRDGSGDMGYYSILNDTATWHHIGGTNTAYSAVGSGDFNKDGYSDILVRNASGDLGYYAVAGDTDTWHPLGASSPAYAVVGVGDFNKDGTSDILFRDARSDLGYYAISNDLFTWQHLGAYVPDFNVAGIGDFNADGISDVLFRDEDGNLGYYQLVL